MTVYCKLCGEYAIKEALAHGLCLECFFREKGRVFIDPLEYSLKYVQITFELEQLRERRKEAVRLCEQYRQEIQDLKAMLEVALNERQ